MSTTINQHEVKSLHAKARAGYGGARALVLDFETGGLCGDSKDYFEVTAFVVGPMMDKLDRIVSAINSIMTEPDADAAPADLPQAAE